MNSGASASRICARLKILARVAAVLGILIGLMVVGDWLSPVEIIRRLLPGLAPMNPVTAVCFVLAGVSLFLQVGASHGVGVRVARVAALLVLVVGILRLESYVSGGDFPLDHWDFHGQIHADGTKVAYKIAPNTAVCLALMGVALLFFERKTLGRVRVAEILAVVICLISLLALLGYLYELSWLYGVTTRLPMALHTACAFLVMGFGILFARPDHGMMEVVTGDGPAGLISRRMFPALFLVFFFVGGLRLLGERRGYYEAELGVALYTVVSIAIFGAFLTWCTWSLHRVDLARRRSEQDLGRFFNQSLDLLGTAGMDGYFKRINPAFSRTLGYTDEELLERRFLDFVHPDDVDPTLAEIASLAEGKPTLHFVNRYLCKDGSWKWLAWNTQPYAEESIMYAAARDITPQKEAELAILRLNAELIQQTSRLESANQELESFGYSVSHDLRAPLRGINGFAQALEDQAGDHLDEIAKGHLERVRNAAQRMGNLIDDLLKLSRLSRAEIRMETVDLGELAQSLVEGYRAAEPWREVEVVIAPVVPVRGDPALLRILLDNLIGNAWKFTSKRKGARIEVGCAVEGGNRARCYVKDNGVGFDKRYKHKLFGAFQRLHSLVDFPGTGIGLATVQRIVRRHGGEVSADGEINHGATFGFTLEAVSKGKTP